MPNLQKKRLLIFEMFNIKKCTFLFGTESINQSIHASVCPTHTIHPLIQCPFLRPSNHLPAYSSIHHLSIFASASFFIHPSNQSASLPINQPTNENNNWISKNTVFNSLSSPEYSVIYSLNVKFRSVMSTVQRVAMVIIDL